MRAEPPVQRDLMDPQIWPWGPRFQQNTLHPLLGLSKSGHMTSPVSSDLNAKITARKRRRPVRRMCRWSPALLSTIRAGISPAPHGVDCPRRLHRIELLDCRLGRRHAGNGEWGGRKQGPHLISDSAIAKTAGMGEATGKAVKGYPLSAAFVLGKFALRDYGNPCAELRQLEELVARNPRARCRENVSGTASAGRDEHMTGCRVCPSTSIEACRVKRAFA